MTFISQISWSWSLAKITGCKYSLVISVIQPNTNILVQQTKTPRLRRQSNFIELIAKIKGSQILGFSKQPCNVCKKKLEVTQFYAHNSRNRFISDAVV